MADLTDALQLARFAEGLAVPTPGDVLNGDLFPNPGTASGGIGDGQLSFEDVEVLLRHLVGLTPLSQLQSVAKLEVFPARANVAAGAGQEFAAPSLDGGSVACLLHRALVTCGR